jgi:hypothetical protein
MLSQSTQDLEPRIRELEKAIAEIRTRHVIIAWIVGVAVLAAVGCIFWFESLTSKLTHVERKWKTGKNPMRETGPIQRPVINRKNISTVKDQVWLALSSSSFPSSSYWF